VSALLVNVSRASSPASGRYAHSGLYSAGTVETMSELKAQLDEAVRCKVELRTCLNTAQEEIEAFDMRMREERAVIKQQQHKV
jgi:hypothetical protein